MNESDMTFTYKCPKCGKPRRLIGGVGNRRLYCNAPGCCSEEAVPAAQKLTVAQMTEGMAFDSLFNKSDDQRKQQAKARRAGTTVKGFATSPYLSESEADTLRAAADILERLGTAAELAKKELKKKEKAEERRQAARRAEAKKVLDKRLVKPERYEESIPMILALAKLDSLHGKHIERDIREALVLRDKLRQRSVRQSVDWEINHLFEDIIRDTLGTIAYREEPSATAMASKFLGEFEAELISSDVQSRAGSLVEAINQRLVEERLEEANPGAGKGKSDGR